MIPGRPRYGLPWLIDQFEEIIAGIAVVKIGRAHV